MTSFSTTCPATAAIDAVAVADSLGTPANQHPRPTKQSRSRACSSFQLTDERQLAYQEYGLANGRPVLYFHDIGSSRLEGSLFDEAAQSAGLRLIAIDRPGIGGSSFFSTSPRQFAEHAVALAASLGIERFALLSLGGGGIYALTLSRYFPQHVQKHVSLGGVPGSAFNETPASGYLANCWNELTPVLFKMVVHVKHQFFPDAGPQDSLSRLEAHLCWQDRKVLQKPAIRRLLKRDQLEALRRGCHGVAQEVSVCYRKFDFKLHDVSVPTVVWQGEADQLSRRSDCEYLAARMPDARLNLVSGAGHFFFLEKLGQVMNSFAVEDARVARLAA